MVEDIEIYYFDVNNRDKFKEIFVMTEGVNMGIIDARLVRYYSDDKVKEMPLKNYVRRMKLASCDGENNLYFWMDTPFYSYQFGCYYCKIRGKVSSSSITLKKQKTYDLEVPNMGLSYSGKSYELRRSMSLYESDSGKAVKQILEPGTEFNALKIKPTNNVFWDYDHYCDVYIKIKTTSGKVGWLLFPGSSSSNSYLVNTPGWG